jgi:hypothetical protein
MSTTHSRPPQASLPLVAGQRLDRKTFHARYEAMPPGIKAELIGGVVHLRGPVGRRHALGTVNAIAWLVHYRLATPGSKS